MYSSSKIRLSRYLIGINVGPRLLSKPLPFKQMPDTSLAGPAKRQDRQHRHSFRSALAFTDGTAMLQGSQVQSLPEHAQYGYGVRVCTTSSLMLICLHRLRSCPLSDVLWRYMRGPYSGTHLLPVVACVQLEPVLARCKSQNTRVQIQIQTPRLTPRVRSRSA